MKREIIDASQLELQLSSYICLAQEGDDGRGGVYYEKADTPVVHTSTSLQGNNMVK